MVETKGKDASIKRLTVYHDHIKKAMQSVDYDTASVLNDAASLIESICKDIDQKSILRKNTSAFN